MAPASVKTAGWYSDPGNSGGVRWWNGHEWTEHVQALPKGMTASQEAPVFNPAAPVALVYATIMLAFAIVGGAFDYAPFVRIGLAVIALVLSIFAIARSRRLGDGWNASIAALAVTGIALAVPTAGVALHLVN